MLNRLKLMTLPLGEGGPKGRMRAGEQLRIVEKLKQSTAAPSPHQSAALRSADSFPEGKPKALPRQYSIGAALQLQLAGGAFVGGFIVLQLTGGELHRLQELPLENFRQRAGCFRPPQRGHGLREPAGARRDACL